MISSSDIKKYLESIRIDFDVKIINKVQGTMRRAWGKEHGEKEQGCVSLA